VSVCVAVEDDNGVGVVNTVRAGGMGDSVICRRSEGVSVLACVCVGCVTVNDDRGVDVVRSVQAWGMGDSVICRKSDGVSVMAGVCVEQSGSTHLSM